MSAQFWSPEAGDLPDLPDLAELSVIARGGYTVVYRAVQVSTGREVALRIDKRPFAQNEQRSRFEQEVRAAGRLSGHPNVVDLYFAGVTDDGRPYVVMELCEGSYADRLDAEGSISDAEVRDIGVQLADALSGAHERGVLHRDIKPANILIRPDGKPVLADFGLAVVTDSVLDTGVHATIGHLTPAYAPLETLQMKPASQFSDVYSLAATLYALLAGHPPRFTGEISDLREVMELFGRPIPDVAGASALLVGMLRAAMTSNPDGRPTADQFREMLDSVPLAKPVTVPPTRRPPVPAPVPPQPAPSAPRSRPRPVPAAANAAPPMPPSAPPLPSPPMQAPPPPPMSRPPMPQPAQAGPPPFQAPPPPPPVPTAPPRPPSRPPAEADAYRSGEHAFAPPGTADPYRSGEHNFGPPPGEQQAPPPMWPPHDNAPKYPGPPPPPYGPDDLTDTGSRRYPEAPPPPERSRLRIPGTELVRSRLDRRREDGDDGGSRTKFFVISGAVILVVLILITWGIVSLFSGGEPESDGEPTGASGPVCGFEAEGVGCMTAPKCFNDFNIDSGVASAKEAECTSEHEWEAFATGALPDSVTSANHPDVAAAEVVQNACMSKEVLKQLVGVNELETWITEVLPPVAADFDSGERTFYCIARQQDQVRTGSAFVK
ncbi:serine/threonine-protein kinase [Phytomonospora sp. NPDC050363]|uniref:serine/threonine-protein kinase n=1 Tax=Phytomonospora sp. NPDC050363 TaxID=3155642 RepID=UPI0033ED40DB